MSKQLHKSYRHILSITKQAKRLGNEEVQVTNVVWCTRDAITSRSVKTRHIGVTTYVNSVKHQACEAWVFNNTYTLNLKVPFNNPLFERHGIDILRRKSEAQAALAYVGRHDKAKRFKGKVRYVSNGQGQLTDIESGLSYHFYLCNFDGADSLYEHLVTNVQVDSGDIVSFYLSSDPYNAAHCGAVGLKIEAKAKGVA